MKKYLKNYKTLQREKNNKQFDFVIFFLNSSAIQKNMPRNLFTLFVF